MADSSKLLFHHRQMLTVDSGIDDSIIEERGYRSVETKTELQRLGFSVAQRCVPTLLIPVWSVLGDVRFYQHRPDEPRLVDGKKIKYESMARKKMIIDVHPRSQKMGDVNIPLLITEGIKKADAASSHGLCTIGLLGVWNFRGTNEYGGKTVLADWEHIALNGRRVYICYDSDVMEKTEVFSALVRLKTFLENRGADVWIIYLPHGEDGRKTGLDDFLALGKTSEDLFRLATSVLRHPVHSGEEENNPYRLTPKGLVQIKEGRDSSITIPLTNFSALITAEVEEDDGAEKKRVFQIEADLNGKKRKFPVSIEKFFSVKYWALQHIGAGAIVYPSQNCEANAATAIQSLSKDMQSATVFKHTGWREIESGCYSYLNAGNIIGEAEPSVVSVHLASPLDRFRLPEAPSGPALVDAVCASLHLLNIGPDSITVPLFSSIWRAASGSADFAIFVTGQSGVFKSEVAALAQQHFGAEMNSRNLPASWEATENFLEGLAFSAKDALLVIDDYAPRGGQQEQAKLAAKADRVLRAQGNHSARGRLNADLTTRSPRPPRGLIVSTGEDIPPGHSLRARNLILEIGKGDVDAKILSICQRDAEEGMYASAMSGYLSWLAPQYETLQVRRTTRVKQLREVARQMRSTHARTPEIIANLGAGLEFFLEFAVSSGAITVQAKDALWERAWRALSSVAVEQGQHLADSEPVQRFLELLRSALASGAAHIAGADGKEPIDAEALGWRSQMFGAGENLREDWRAQGERVGWIDGRDLYLEPGAAYQVAKRRGEMSGDGIAIGQKTLHRLIRERNILISYEEKRGALARRNLQGSRRDVLHLDAETLLGPIIDRNAATVVPQPKLLNGKIGQFGQLADEFLGAIDDPDWNTVPREEYST